jgi:hypothetical protein
MVPSASARLSDVSLAPQRGQRNQRIPVCIRRWKRRMPELRSLTRRSVPALVSVRSEAVTLSPNAGRAATIRDGIRRVVDSDSGRHGRRPSASIRVARIAIGWMPAVGVRHERPLCQAVVRHPPLSNY